MSKMWDTLTNLFPKPSIDQCLTLMQYGELHVHSPKITDEVLKAWFDKQLKRVRKLEAEGMGDAIEEIYEEMLVIRRALVGEPYANMTEAMVEEDAEFAFGPQIKEVWEARCRVYAAEEEE